MYITLHLAWYHLTSSMVSPDYLSCHYLARPYYYDHDLPLT